MHPRIWATVLVLALLPACTTPTTSQTSSAASTDQDVQALRELEASVLTAVKRATTKLAAIDMAGASDHLVPIGPAGKKILDWLDTHPAFANANTATAACLRETMTDLGKQAEVLAPRIRANTATSDQVTKLRADLGEAANCIQSGD
jgi:hypothetical protein